MNATTFTSIPSLLKRVLVAAVMVALSATAAFADTLLMPKRDGQKGQPMVVWGVTTLANGTPFTLDYGDGTSTVGTVVDRSYIAFPKTYNPSGAVTTYTVKLTVGSEQATVDVRILDPGLLPGGVNGEAARGLRINMAIENGLRYLWQSQANRGTNFPNGALTSWTNGAGWPQQWTALVTLAFQNHGYRLPSDGTAPTGVYERFIVRRGLNYVLTNLTGVALAAQAGNATYVPPQPLRDPCVGLTTSPCSGLRPTSADPGYATGVAMLPLAASGVLSKVNTEAAGAANGMTYREILQRLSNALAWGQTDGNGTGRGGWGYNFNNGNFDGSTAGWALLGFMDAEAAGIVVPKWVKDEFAVGLSRALNNNGSLDYGGDGNPAALGNVNLEKAGIGLQGMFFIGEVGSARANVTKTYISDRWNSGRIGGDYTGWSCGGAIPNRGCGYAMFNNYKGLKLQGFTTLAGVTRPAGPGAILAGDWYADYQDWLVANQTNPNATNGGNWAGMVFTINGITSNDAVAALAELILSPVALVLPDEEKFRTVGLSPSLATAVEGNSHTITAKAESANGAPVAGATINFEIISGPNAGLTFTGLSNAAGQVVWTYTDAGPIPSFGTDRIVARIGTLESNVAEMVWTPFNRPPVATNNAYSVNEDGTLNGNVVFDAPADSDPDNDELHASVESDVSHGALALLSTGGFQYLPVPNYCGPDSFTYSVNDGMYDSDVATVNITVVCVNDGPTAGDDAAATDEDTPVNGSVAANDADVEGDALTWAKATDPAKGSVIVNADGTYTYTPNADECGTDSFTYSVSDGGLSGTATVNVTIACINDAPSADDDTVATNEDTPVSASVAANDADVDSASLTWTRLTDPSKGSVAFNADGSYTYTPNVNECGADSFTYSVSDGSLSDEATVTIAIACVNDAPVANDAAAATDEDSAAGGQLTSSDVDGPSATYSLGGGASNGSAVVNADGTFTYTPNANFCGNDSFSFSVSDGSAADTATVAITVNCVNDAPVADDSAETTAEDTPLAGAATSSDIDGPGATYSVASGPAHGTLALNADGTYVYTPALNYNGPDSFTFTVSDGSGGSDTGEVSITVTPVNDVPFCAAAAPSIASLWPPNHELVDIAVLGVTDPVEKSAITIEVTDIFQDEPTNTLGDGNTLVDGFGVGTPTAQVRRERSGSKRVPGDGRMYYIYFTGTDAEGGKCTGVVQVGVPHDLGQDHVIGAGGPIYRSTGQ
ncbi:MAG TPA: Ig-like domain-containing protein [Vicinamibacterales bacterium]